MSTPLQVFPTSQMKCNVIYCVSVLGIFLFLSLSLLLSSSPFLILWFVCFVKEKFTRKYSHEYTMKCETIYYLKSETPVKMETTHFNCFCFFRKLHNESIMWFVSVFEFLQLPQIKLVFLFCRKNVQQLKGFVELDSNLCALCSFRLARQNTPHQITNNYFDKKIEWKILMRDSRVLLSIQNIST